MYLATFIALMSAGLQSAQIGAFHSAREEASLIALKTHKRVSVASKLGGEIVFVSPRGASPDVELAGVAAALNASVVPEAGGLVIRRTQKDEREIERAFVKERTDWFHLTLARVKAYRFQREGGRSPQEYIPEELRRQLGALNNFFAHQGPAPTDLYSVGYMLPCEDLLEGLISRIGPETLAGIPVGQVREFESEPKLDATALPDCSDLVDKYEQALVQFKSIKLDEQTRKAIELAQNDDAFLHPERLGNPPATIRFVARSSRYGIDLSLELFDAAGRHIDKAVLTIWPRGKMTSMYETASARAMAGDLVVPVSAESEQAGGEYRSPKLARLPDWLLHPEKEDPIDLFARDAVAGLSAEDPSKCFVADVPDSLCFWAALCFKDHQLNVSAFKALVQEQEGYRKVSGENFVVWRPANPAYAELQRADRKTLGKFMRQFAEDQFIWTRTKGKLWHEGFPAVWSFASKWSNLEQMTFLDVPSQGSMTDAFYSLVGAIKDEDWAGLESGATMTAGQLGILPELEALFHEDQANVQGNEPYPDLYKHPVELYGPSSLADTPISIRKTKEQVVVAWSPGRKEIDFWEPLEVLYGEFGVKATVEGPPKVVESREEFEASASAKLNMRLATRINETIIIGLPHGLFIAGDMPTRPEEKSEVMTYQDLPQSIRDQIWQRACELAIKRALEIQKRLGLSGG